MDTAGGNYYPPTVDHVEAGYAFGVGGTASTGTYHPPPYPSVNVTGCVNNADGTYTASFDNVHLTGSGGVAAPDILLWSPGQNAWIPVSAVNVATGTSLIFTETLGDTDCTLLGVLGQPGGLNFGPDGPLNPSRTTIM